MALIIEELKGLVNIYFIILVVFIGLFNLYIDTKQLKKKGLDKDMKISKFIGLTYIAGGSLLYIILKIA